MRIGFIGAGKVGCSLAGYFSARGAEISGVYGRSGAPKSLPCFRTANEVIENSDVIFMTVTDSAIAEVWNGSDKRIFNSSNKILCHCSGSLSSEIFTEADPMRVCSVHPMLAFASKNVPVDRISEAFFTVEGGETALKAVGSILKMCKNPYRVIAARDKAKYHAAACFASNFVVALCSQSFELMRQCGFEEVEARKALSALIEGNAGNICERGIQGSLTGPVARGDAVTIEKHMKALCGRELEVYKLLSARLAELSGHDELKKILEGKQ